MFTKYWTIRFLGLWVLLWILNAIGLKAISPLFVLTVVLMLVDDNAFHKQAIGILLLLSFFEDLLFSYYFGTHFLALGTLLLIIEGLRSLLSINDILKTVVFGVFGYAVFFIIIRIVYVISGVSMMSFFELTWGWYNVIAVTLLYFVIVGLKDALTRKLKI
ncbi:hypothetical protein JW962_01705 [Candidatus Dojkabacteria bacterium]|nr:hypothetical protein [Candidatus Dojkabacteria bacterium]